MKKSRWPLFLLICFMLYLLGTRIYQSRNVLAGNNVYFRAEELFTDGRQPLGEITSDIFFEQTIKIERSTSAIDLLFATYARENSGILRIYISDLETDTVYYDSEIDIKAMQDNAYIRLSFNNIITVVDNEYTYLSVKITAPESSDGNAVTIWGSMNDKYADGSLSINGEEIQADIAFALVEQHKNLITLLVVFFSIICILIVFLAYYFLYSKKISPNKMFLFLGISLGFFSLLINPPGSIPDEIAHVHTSYLWSNSIMGLDSQVSDNAIDSNNVYAIWESYRRLGDFDNIKDLFSSTPSVRTYIDIVENWKWISINEDARNVESRFFRVNGAIAQYLFTTIGISLARILSIGFFPLLYLGALFNLAFFVFAIHWAIKRTPIGKNMMLIIATLPMVVHLSPSYSYDSPILALSFMFIAQIFWLSYGNYDYIKNKDIVLTAIIAIFFFPCKVMAYLPLLLLLLLIPKSRFKNKQGNLIFFLGIAAVSLLSVLVNNWSTARTFLNAEEGAWSNRLGNAGYTFGWILEHPFRFLTICWNTARESIGLYFNTMIGSKLNWLNTPVSEVAIFTMVICLFAVSVREENDMYVISNKQKLVILSACTLCSLFIGTGMLLWETSFGSAKIIGIQGRYFLPLLPALIFTIRTKQIVASDGLWRNVAMAAICAEAMALTDNFFTIIIR